MVTAARMRRIASIQESIRRVGLLEAEAVRVGLVEATTSHEYALACVAGYCAQEQGYLAARMGALSRTAARVVAASELACAKTEQLVERSVTAQLANRSLAIAVAQEASQREAKWLAEIIDRQVSGPKDSTAKD